jgi:hypothetical protein
MFLLTAEFQYFQQSESDQGRRQQLHSECRQWTGNDPRRKHLENQPGPDRRGDSRHRFTAHEILGSLQEAMKTKLSSMRWGMFIHDRKISLTLSGIGTSRHLLIVGQIMRGAIQKGTHQFLPSLSRSSKDRRTVSIC